ncbi:MAG: transporter [Candidatus Binatia bacterium]
MKTTLTTAAIVLSSLVAPINLSLAQNASNNAPSATRESKPSDDAAELAKKLQNPIAALISVPIQNNFDFGAGPGGDGFQYKVNIQPVIPITLNENWNLISRTILPVVYQDKIFGNTSQSGLSDTLQSLFFSPQKPTSGGWIWGAGPVFLLPTATDDLLGSEKWGAGPTAVVLKQEKGWTYGMLANQVWSFAGEEGRQNVNSTFLQPFVAYTTKRQTTFTINSESTYDWENEHWTAPLNFMVAQLVKVGKMPIQLQVGARYYADKPENGPDWGLRFTATLLLPK